MNHDKDFQSVPCNGCVRCCIRDAIRLLPEDDPSLYKTIPHWKFKGTLMLDHKKDNTCIYLGNEGCTIQGTKPLMCQTMDCRDIAKKITFTQARKIDGLLPVWRKGKELLRNE